MTSPQGRRFDQQRRRSSSREKQHVVFLCGRYEGFDHRVHEALQPDEISIGDFVVSGGELPAMLMADAIGRLVEGVVGNTGSVEEDSFFHGLLDYPHYTRPEELRGMRVPDILLSGHHENIRKWRKEQALRATLEKRPDLLETAELDDGGAGNSSAGSASSSPSRTGSASAATPLHTAQNRRSLLARFSELLELRQWQKS